jgi:uncharacterized protein
MFGQWLPLQDIPAEGRDFLIEDQSIWADPIEEFKLPYTLLSPMALELLIVKQEEGCLLRGRVRGRVSMPCARCSEAAEVSVDGRFEIFEPFESEDGAGQLEQRYYRQVDDHLEINAGAIAWEQFLLGLPVKSLCAQECEGICPHCGQNLNAASCSCHEEDGDPRMEVFRRLRIE